MLHWPTLATVAVASMLFIIYWGWCVFACMYVFQLFDSVSRVKVGNVVEMLGVILRWGWVLVCLRVKSDMIDNVDMNYNGQLIDNITILLINQTSNSYHGCMLTWGWSAVVCRQFESIVYGHDIGSIVMVIHQSRCALYTHHVIYTPQLDTPRVHIYPCPSRCYFSSSSAVHLTAAFCLAFCLAYSNIHPSSVHKHTHL